jgi:hypothetical protein
MKEMNDYSGPFRPDARWEDFSKEFLIKIMRLWQQAYLEMAGSWYGAVEKRCGFDTAVACEDEAWNKVVERMTPKYVKAANTRLNTALDSLKVLQLPPDNTQGDMYPVEYDVRNENHVVMSIKSCPGYEYWEKTGQTTRMNAMCCGEAPVLNPKYGGNPKFKGKQLKRGPRTSKSEPVCIWEWTLEG